MNHVGSGQGTDTDANGQYILSELPTGFSLIRVSYIGYRSAEIVVNLFEEESYVLNVELVGGIDPDQVQITASRRQEKIMDAPASIDVILVEDLARAVVPSTVMSLRNVTGLDTAQTGVDRNEVVLRGFNNVFSGATLVLTDYRDAGSASVNINLHSLMPNLSVDLVRDISTGILNNTTLATVLGLFGLNAEQAAQLLVDVAGGSLPNAETPITIVQPNENNPRVGQVPEMMLSYPNFGDISYYGMDESLQVIVLHALSFFGNMPWVSDDFFDHTELKEELDDKVLALNAPSFKFKLGGQYEHRSRFSVNASGRYIKGFPVISGPYIGDVPSYFVLDIGAGYEINSVLRADVGINNATNSNHREFVGSPRLGRLASARLTYTVDWR